MGAYVKHAAEDRKESPQYYGTCSAGKFYLYRVVFLTVS